jgi:hypothetical protein
MGIDKVGASTQKPTQLISRDFGLFSLDHLADFFEIFCPI